MNILMWLEDWDGRVPMPAVLKPEPLWTGKQVVNLIIPRVNVRRKAAWSKDHEDQDMTPYDSQVPFYVRFCGSPEENWCHFLFFGTGRDTRKLVSLSVSLKKACTSPSAFAGREKAFLIYPCSALPSQTHASAGHL